MYRVRQRINGKWVTVAKRYSFKDIVEEYNCTSAPKMLIRDDGHIQHKQYTENGFVYHP